MEDLRPDLLKASADAPTKKVPLGMDPARRIELMDILLKISDLAGKAFDILDSQEISEADVYPMLCLPDYCNAFTSGMMEHARTKIRRKNIG